MVGRNSDTIDQLDQLWDETIHGIPYRPSALDPELARTVGRIHTLNDAVVPDAAFARRLWTDLSQPIAAVNKGGVHSAPSPSFRSELEESAGPSTQGRIPRQARNDGRRARSARSPLFSRLGWQRAFAQVLTMAILLVTLAAGYAALRLQPASNTNQSAVSDPDPVELFAYVFTGTGESSTDTWDVTPLNPKTLAEIATDQPTTSQPPAWAGSLSEEWSPHLWALSADGSTYVAVESRQWINGVPVKEATIGVYDAQTGVERIRFDLPAFVRDTRLSYDGTRLVIQAHPNPAQIGDVGRHDPPEWFVVDTADGHVVAKIESDEQNGWHADSWIDPTASRLYRLFIPYSPEKTGPGATRIVANDLTTGADIARLDLPEVRSGVWVTDRTHTVTGGVEYPVIAELRPGVALSPDGKMLALVHADVDAVTLIDTARLLVERTVTLSRPIGWEDRLIALLPLVPADAAAKGAQEGTALQAVYAADGRHLYVFGSETTTDDEGEVAARSLGLRLIDLKQAEIAVSAEELADEWISRVVPSPNGRDLYVCGFLLADDLTILSPSRLWRLDASTLEVHATRAFPDTLLIRLSPTVPDGRRQIPPGAG
ncbi:MAG: hypothetical protein ACRDJW_24200 [Thermomicrobiales bacterium]